MIRNYDITLLFSPELNEERINQTLSALSEKAEEEIKKTAPQRIGLSYKIGDKENVVMGVIKVKAKSEEIKEIKKEISQNSKIIRHLIVKEEIRAKKEKRRVMRKVPRELDRKENIVSGKKEKADIESIEEKIDTILDK